MVELAGLIGMLTFVGASTAVGARLLWVGQRTRRLPERMIGLSFLLAGTLGAGLGVAAAVGSSHPAGPWLAAGSSLAVDLGVACLAVFTWRVFRPSVPWAAALFGASLLVLAVGFVGQLTLSGFAYGASRGLWGWVELAPRLVLYAWASGESLLQHRAGRRRVALGLADPLVVDRFRLWGIGLLAVEGIWMVLGLARGLGWHFQATYVPTALLGFVCAGALWLAFFPPQAYQRHVAAHARS